MWGLRALFRVPAAVATLWLEPPTLRLPVRHLNHQATGDPDDREGPGGLLQN